MADSSLTRSSYGSDLILELCESLFSRHHPELQLSVGGEERTYFKKQ